MEQGLLRTKQMPLIYKFVSNFDRVTVGSGNGLHVLNFCDL